MTTIREKLHELGINVEHERIDVQQYSTCPVCSHTRTKKNQHDKCLGFKVASDDMAYYRCNHDGCQIGSHPTTIFANEKSRGSNPPRRRQKPKPQGDPEPQEMKPTKEPVKQSISAELEAWLSDRALTVETARQLGIYSDTLSVPVEKDKWEKHPSINFPYRVNGELINIKRRSLLDKHKQRQVTGQPRSLFNIDNVAAHWQETGDHTIIWVEGEFDVMAVYQAGFKNVTTMSDGGSDRNFDRHQPRYLGLFNNKWIFNADKIIIFVDDDFRGHCTRYALTQLFGGDKCVIVEYPAIADIKVKDANDVINEHRDEGHQLIQEMIQHARPLKPEELLPPPPEQKPEQDKTATDGYMPPIVEEEPRTEVLDDCFEMFSIEQMYEIPSVEYLVEGLITENGFASIYGPPGEGKTFTALDMAMSVMSGKHYHGRYVKKGGVLYISGEGWSGLQYRVKAWQRYHENFERKNMKFIGQRVNFLDDKDVQKLLNSINSATQDGFKFELVVLDTVARSFGSGNENNPEDMNAFIATCDKIRETTKVALLAIHHTGKDISRGARGHNSWKGALDTNIEVKKEVGTEVVSVNVEKQKDDDGGKPLYFDFTKVHASFSRASLVPQITYKPEVGQGARNGNRGTSLSEEECTAIVALEQVTQDEDQVRADAWHRLQDRLSKCEKEGPTRRKTLQRARDKIKKMKIAEEFEKGDFMYVRRGLKFGEH